MTGLEFLALLAVTWFIAAPDQHTLKARGGALGAVRAGGGGVRDRARTEWSAARPNRPERPDRPGSAGRRGRLLEAFRRSRPGRFALAAGRIGATTWRAARAGGRVAAATGRVVAAGGSAARAGWREGAATATQKRRDRRDRRDRRTKPHAVEPTVELEPAVGPEPAATPEPVVGPEPVVELDELDEPSRVSEPGEGLQVELEPDQRAVQLSDGRVLSVRVDTGPPRTAYEQVLSPESLARHRQLVAIRQAGYDGWLDQDLKPVPAAADGWPAVLEHAADSSTSAATSAASSAASAGCSWTVSPYLLSLRGIQVPCGRPATIGPLCAEHHAQAEQTQCLRCLRLLGSNPSCEECRRFTAQSSAPQAAAAAAGAAFGDTPVHPLTQTTGPAPAGPANPSTTTPTKESVMPEIAEFETTADLRAEAEELETMAEEIHAARAEFERRTKALEEKVGAAPFGTRAIAEAVTAVGEATTTDDAAEGLVELRRALDESDAIADVRDSLEAKGSVEAFASA